MPSEQEELRLTVSLVDHASAGIVALRNQITGLTSGQAKQSFDTFQRQQKEMSNQIKELTGVAFGGEKALLGYIGKFGALGLAMSAGIGVVKEFAKSMNDIGRLGQSLGVPATQIKNIVDQLKAHGASQAEATAEVEGFTKALVQMGRIGSPQYQALLQRSGQFSTQMATIIAQMENAKTVEEKMNIAREAAANIQKNRYQQDITLHKSESEAQADSTAAANEFLEVLGLHLSTQQRIEGQIKSMTAAEAAHQAQLIKEGEEVTAQWNKIGESAEHAEAAMLKAFGPSVIQVLQSFTDALEGLGTTWENINKQAEAFASGKAFSRAKEYLDQGDIAGAIVGRPGGPSGKEPIPHTPGASWFDPGAPVPHFFGLDQLPKNQTFDQMWKSRVPGMQHGGIVSRPTLAMIGEAGPEAVVPLGGGGGFGGGRATQDNTRETTDNTKQLTRLNDQLFEMLHPTGAGAPGGGIGGVSPMGGLPGFGGGGGFGGRGGAPGGGSAPYGSDAGPGTGEGAGGGAASGSLAEQRAQFKKEFDADPKLKAFAIDAMQHEGGIQSNMEQLMNMAAMRHQTIRQALFSHQYGPVNSGLISANISAKTSAAGEAALQKVYGGSNITDYATDQGMKGDPNYDLYQSNPKYWGMHKVEGAWFSAHGEPGRKWAAEQRARDEAAKAENQTATGGGDHRNRFIAEARRGRIPAMADGGLVTKPTFALIGEAGPEMVVPLTREMAGIAAIGQSETGFNTKEAYSDFYNDPRKRIGGKRNPGYNANVAKIGASGADYGFFQMNQTDVDDAIKRGMDPDIAKHLRGGGKEGTSSPDDQVAALHQYLSLRYPSYAQLGATGEFEPFRKAASHQFFGLSRAGGAPARSAFEQGYRRVDRSLSSQAIGEGRRHRQADREHQRAGRHRRIGRRNRRVQENRSQSSGSDGASTAGGADWMGGIEPCRRSSIYPTSPRTSGNRGRSGATNCCRRRLPASSFIARSTAGRAASASSRTNSRSAICPIARRWAGAR